MARTRGSGSYDTIGKRDEEHTLRYLYNLLLSDDIPVEISVSLADMCVCTLSRMASADARRVIRRFSSADNVQDPLVFLKSAIGDMYATRVRLREDRTQSSIHDYFHRRHRV